MIVLSFTVKFDKKILKSSLKQRYLLTTQTDYKIKWNKLRIGKT